MQFFKLSSWTYNQIRRVDTFFYLLFQNLSGYSGAVIVWATTVNPILLNVTYGLFWYIKQTQNINTREKVGDVEIFIDKMIQEGMEKRTPKLLF